ncbi:unnamed protein product [Brassica rapa]|uniref:Protein kinase domain-containing protein n=1 Tax=Brassica campestris TaxID=3711 RepID=A0A8D9HED5_BRACM|nr:unnamed protein product [Brassica rapa]
MVLECVTGRDLFDRIVSKGKLSETEGRKMFQQLIDGISYCHNKGIFHRDLKLENVLLDENGHIKITDFGVRAVPQHFRLKAIREESTRKGPGGLSLTAEVFEIILSLNVIELRKSHGDSSPYKQLCERLLHELDASSQI